MARITKDDVKAELVMEEGAVARSTKAKLKMLDEIEKRKKGLGRPPVREMDTAS